ncbi:MULTISPECIES: bifunctional enoyl-CoA hydratase/phosphate acetyltransferase [Methylosinus]|uniref:Phosphate acetyltransferase n=1 Tax=Methylosinus trichosporium (strain ATCC 35070 / NCIMB 11131 / UNIQEM 75 / OB3b) TaxID=595536 RepID=A0A2D2D2H6_METT3|nr:MULTISPECIES: bifunctional enoyl-CoA hydratase/phosphate acetyltransferase [Methylosinus]ATQ69176.1 phosphate acetyltransferase [Methylosinus trichosporium OB3b]OBS53599.1 phosphate acetyltransferase [Methylosinus sp. 3S-1]
MLFNRTGASDAHVCRAFFDELLERCRALPPIRMGVVHPCDPVSLKGALAARDAGLVTPVIVAPRAKIASVAAAAGISLDDLDLVDAPHSHAAAARAVELVRGGEVDALMKGSLHTDELMGAVVREGSGLRTERRISHVFVLDVPSYCKPLLVTDAAINIAPTLAAKRDIAQNAIDLAHALGIARPKLAALSAVETVDAAIPSTIDAAALCKMADRGQITGADVDGPLAFDNAISLEAAKTKGITSSVAGDADILLAPDLEAGNILAKQLVYLAGAEDAGLVLGARAPIVLTSRADGVRARVVSCALAQLFAHRTLEAV